MSGFGGYEFRGKPDGALEAPSGAFRWGAGVAFPSRNFLRVTGELNGELPNKDAIIFPGAQILCVDCPGRPLTSNTENLTRATVGLTGQAIWNTFIIPNSKFQILNS
ncbi:MAG: hypothetical protein AUI64_01235 [Acidobacteria bacterium 13_1_40CM_2_64_6]|nr:MAG: hypothetical protein AUH43_08740 [Acidobacteria bacterium 13_1_40CM_65_14]OLD57004.1 MAG: hypothetical protein AUI64_01235 [Acidobacteria bacterium 13_1_40CM_2_64_6]